MDNRSDRQCAVIASCNGTLKIAYDVLLPPLAHDTIMVRNAVVGLNPVDVKMVGSLATPNAIAGMDFAGHVIAVGSQVEAAADIKIGDRVCGAVQGMHSLTPSVGAFAQIVGASDVVTLKLPTSMSLEEGASLGSGIGTVGLALFHSLKLPGTPTSPTTVPRHVLVYGGSSATGTLALQILKLSGFTPIATCSPKNFALVQSYGAEAVFDYKSPSASKDIRTHTKNSLRYVLDCISEPQTMRFCYACVGRAGGKYTALEPFPSSLHTRQTIQPDWVLGPTLLGKRIAWDPPFGRDENPEMRKFALDWFKIVQELLDTGRLRTHPLRVMDGGLEDVLKGIQLLGQKAISGEKLVVRI